jgi:serine protease AprX
MDTSVQVASEHTRVINSATSPETDHSMVAQHKSSTRRWMQVALALCLSVGSLHTAVAQNNLRGGMHQRKIAADLDRNGSPDKLVDVIVQYKMTPQTRHYAKMAGRGAWTKARLHSINSAAFKIPASALAELEADPDVAFVSPDRQVKQTSTSTDFYDQAVGAPYAWSRGLDGSGIAVAVIDSGVTDNGDFSGPNGSRVVYSQNFSTDGVNNAYGHGSHVAGILAGNGANSTGSNYFKTFQGIAQEANIVSFRVLDGNGIGTDSDVIAAIQQAIALKSTYNIRVINLSLGRQVTESYKLDPLCQAVEAAWRAGIVVVVAAGNDGRDNVNNTSGYGTISAPGNDPYVITVGAMKPMSSPDRGDDFVASYSSKGPTLVDHLVKPDLVAPGNWITSTLASTSATLYTELPHNQVPMNTYSYTGGTAPSTKYFTLSGTSMATPVVSGAAVLLLQQNPSLTPDQVKARLMKTAYKNFPRYSTATDTLTGARYTSQYDIFTVGAGYLDIQAALNNTDTASSTIGSAMSPAVTKDSNGNIAMVKNSSVIWGSSVLWGSSVVWGSSVIWGTNVSGQSVLWGSSVVWGSSSNRGYSVLWGSSVMWGSSILNTADAESVILLGEN